MDLIKKILNWVTKLLSIAILGIVLFIVGAHCIEGLAPIAYLLSTKEIQLSVAMGVLFLGTLVGLKWRLLGGLLTIVGYISFACFEESIMLGMLFNLFLITGVFNIILYWWSKK